MDENFIRVPVPSNIVEILRNHTIKYSEKPVIIFQDGNITYQEFNRVTNQVAQGLLNYGVKKGDRIAILTRNIPEFLITFFAASKIGALTVPINHRLSVSQIEYLLTNCAPFILVTESEFLEKIEKIKMKFQHMIVFSVGSYEPDVGVTPFDLLYKDQDPSEVLPEINIDDDLMILYTSGTTGRPKGAVITHRNVIAWAVAYKYATNMTAEDRTLIAVPLFHQTGLCDQFLTALFLGGTCILMRRFKTEDCLKLIDKHKPTTWVMAPTMLIWMMDFPAFDKYDTSSVRINCYGGGPISSETIKKVKKNFPNAQCYNVFGSTEGYISFHPDEQCLNRPDSIGLPVIYNQVRLVDEDGREVPVGQMGEIIVKGDGIIKRYWNDPVANEKAFRGRWFCTGDVAKMDEAGYLYLGDRKKDIICRGGENIYSIEVENVLNKHPAVLEAAVFGISDYAYGEIPKAAVVLKKGKNVSENEMKEFCAKYLADYEIPNGIIFLDKLPTNPVGKVEKRMLREKY